MFSVKKNNKPSRFFPLSRHHQLFNAVGHVSICRSLIPYGLPCLRELFRFLVSLINPHEMSGGQSDSMIQIALSLLATALETGAEHLVRFSIP